MNNKVLIKLIVPELDETYDIFIPVNELVWKVKAMTMKCVSDLNHLPFSPKLDFYLMNKEDGTIYNDNDIIINTNIRNGSEIFAFFRK